MDNLPLSLFDVLLEVDVCGKLYGEAGQHVGR